MKKHKKPIIALGILAAIVIVAFIAILPLYTTNSNIENYTGVKREAAERTIDHDKSFDSDSLTPPFLPAQIIEVKQNTQRPCTSDPNNEGYYAVTMRRVWLFGMTYKSGTYLVCNMGW